MAAKIFIFFALLALSVSAATAYISPASIAAANIVPLYLQQATAIAATHPCVQLQALASGILTPSTMLIQQPLAILQQQCQAHLAIQSIMTVQQQQQLLVNPAATLLPNVFNQLALVNPITTAYLQQQQLLSNVFNQLALANLVASLQQQQLLSSVFNQVSLANPIAYSQQQQLLSTVFNQVALAHPAAYLQQPFIGGAIF